MRVPSISDRCVTHHHPLQDGEELWRISSNGGPFQYYYVRADGDL